MAEVKTIKIDVDTKGAVDAMENLSKATHDVSASFEEVYGDLQPLTTRMGEAEDRLYELANAGQTASQEYQDLLTTVGNYRKVQIQTDMAVDAAATTMSQKLGGALGGVSAGFELAQGVMGTFGAESAQVEQALLKVQSAMAISQGIQGVRESVASFKALGDAIKATSAFQKILTAFQWLYNTALAANPIGAIIAGIAALIAIGYKLITMFQDSAEANEKAAASTKKSTEALNKQIAASQRASEALKTKNGHEYEMAKASGASAEALRKLALKHADEEIALEKATLATAKNTYEKEKNTLASYKSLGVSDEVIEKQRELVTKSREALKEEYSDLKEAYQNRQEIARQNQVEVRQEQTDLKNAQIQAAKEASEKVAEQRKAANEKAKETKKAQDELIAKSDAEAKRIAIEKENEFQQKLEEISEQNYLNTLTDQDRELLAVQDKYFQLETLAEGNATALQEIEIAKMNELNDINLKYQQQAYDLDAAAKEKKKELDKKAAEDEIAQAKAVEEQKRAIQMQGLEVASQGVALIKGVFEKSKGVQKAAVIAESAIGIAKMIIANKAANVAALATPQAIATSGAAAVPVIAMNNISTAIGIAGNVAATAKALQSLGGGSTPTPPSVGGGGGSAGGGMQAQAPQFNVVGNSGINQLAQLQQTPVQAYVVSGEVTSAQSLDRNRVQNATL
jgi:hypothetical protein